MGDSISVVAMDPGLMPGTGLARDYPVFLQFVWKYILPYIAKYLINGVHTTEESGTALAHLAISSTHANTTGKYFSLEKEIPSSKDSYDTSKQNDLWITSVKLAKLNQNETVLKLN